MLVGFYIAAFVISVLETIILIYMMRKSRSIYFLLMFVAVMNSNAGYLAVALAKNVEEALLGTKFTYVLGCFLPICIFMIISRECRIKLQWWIMPVLLTFSCVVMGLSMTAGYSDIYYKSVELHSYMGVSYITKVYGPLHVLYYVMIVLYVCLDVVMIIYSFFRQEVASYKNSIIIVCVEILTISVYVLERVINSPIELMPFACDIALVFILILMGRMRMYDISAIVADSMEHLEENGYIIFDSSKRYLGSNDRAKAFLPELAELKLDYEIDKKYEFLRKELLGIIASCEKVPKFFKKAHYITRDDLVIKCILKHIYHGRKRGWIGYIMELSDDTKQQKYISLINNYNTELESAVEEKVAHIRDMQNKMIMGIADIVENRDNSTGGHIKRTSMVVQVFVDELRANYHMPQLTDKFCENLIKAAPMHDLGKITVDDDILRKPGKYTPEEFEAMKMHAAAGRKIVENVLKDVEEPEFISLAANVANYHHEKWNGQGYPEHLKGEEIPFEARIMALADVFDALVSKRCYKEKMSFDEAFRIIADSLGSHFDPILGKCFIKCRSKLEALYEGVE